MNITIKQELLAMVLQALDRDAAEGRSVRGEMAAELRAAIEAQDATVPKGWSIQRVFNPSGYTIQMPDGGFLRITDFGGGGVETAFAKFICALLASTGQEVKP